MNVCFGEFELISVSLELLIIFTILIIVYIVIMYSKRVGRMSSASTEYGKGYYQTDKPIEMI